MRQGDVHGDRLDAMLQDCKNLVAAFAEMAESNPVVNALKLNEEAGEVAGAVFKGTSEDMLHEIADVIICAMAQLYFTGHSSFDLQRAVQKKLEKGYKRVQYCKDRLVNPAVRWEDYK